MENFLQELLFTVTADTKGATLGLANLGKELEKLNVSAVKTQTTLQKFTSVSNTVGKASGIMLTGFIGLAVAAEHFSKQFEIANAQVANTFNQMGYNANALMPYVDRLEQAFTGLTFTVGDTAEAYNTLVTGLRSPVESMRLMGTVADFAAKTHMSLNEAALATVKAAQGQSRAFKQVGVSFNDGATTAEKFANGMKKVAENTKGAAEALAKTDSGSLQVMKAQSEAALATLGGALAPLLVRLAAFVKAFFIPAINGMSDAFKKNTGEIKTFVDVMLLTWLSSKVIAGIVGFIKILNLVKEAYYTVKVAALAAGGAEAFAEGLTIVGLGAVAAAGAAVVGVMKLVNNAIDSASKGLDSGSKSMLDYNKIVADMMKNVKNTPINFNTSSTGTKPTLANDWNATAKAIQSAAEKIQTSLKTLSGLSVGKSVADLALDPLTKALNEAKTASVDFSSATNKLLSLTNASAQADLAYVSSMKDVTTAGQARTTALKNAADVASASAVKAAEDADAAIQKIMSAQQTYANEVISRVNAMRSAFQNATNFDIGSTASNITAAKKNLADAQQALLDAQNKFKTQVSTQTYDNVITNTALPVFTAEQNAVQKAQDDLAIALGTKQSPFLATADELQKALQTSYDNSVQLSQTAGQLSAAGFSQEFINQVISQGPDLGVQLGKAILSSSDQAQSSMSALFNNMLTVSKTGVNDLSIKLNQDAINVMDSFVTNFGNINISPIDSLLNAIKSRVDAMVLSIQQAIQAILAQIALLNQQKVTTAAGTTGYGGTLLSSGAIAGVTDANGNQFFAPAPGAPSITNPTGSNNYGGLGGSTGFGVTYGPGIGASSTVNNVSIINYQPTDTASAMSDVAWGIKTSLDNNYTLPTPVAVTGGTAANHYNNTVGSGY